MTLSYDCAFLALVLAALTEGAVFRPGNCGPRVYRGKRPIAEPSAILDYAADVNILLAWYQAADDARDEKNVKSLAARFAFARAYHKAAKANPALDREIAASMVSLSRIEAEKIPSTDEPSDAFGKLLTSVVLRAPMLPGGERRAAEWMFYNLGKWIYLIDAWDDREKDEKNGNYNPFLLANMSVEQAEFLLNITRGEAQKGYDLLTLNQSSGLLDNIMRLGLYHTQRRVLHGENGCQAENASPEKEKGDKE
ncbi:hypothetical protein SDC9_171292 [bioreactor metagenome]|uniref:Uncharacterized protein n=1 Tax=bioreactor metagenome TaxID=1076179 RepID=A0A645GDQ0_9ZZZZ